MSEGKHLLSDLIGRKVTAVRMNEEYLGFETDKGSLVYRVEGDCCSSSYFYDFHGVQKLLDNGPVTEVGDVNLDPTDLKAHDDKYDEIAVYGYKIISESKWGDQTSVFSFRNSSNGYYGGWMDLVSSTQQDISHIPLLTGDVLGQ